MTKQEEIREALMSKIKSIRLWRTRYDEPLTVEDDAEDILNYLHSQGVVIKVESELTILADKGKQIAGLIKEAGYTAVEPLIEVK